MYSQDILDLKQYKSLALSNEADVSILLYKIASIIQEWEFTQNQSLATVVEDIDSRLSFSNDKLDSILTELSTSLSSIVSGVQSLDTNSASLSQLSILSSLQTSLQTLQGSIVTLQGSATLSNQTLSSIQDKLDVISPISALTLLNTTLSGISVLVQELKNLINQSRLNTAHSFPHFLLVPLPLFPSALYVTFPRATSSFSFSLVSDPSLPDTYNSSSRFHLSLPEHPSYNVVPDPDDPCPCLLSLDQVSAWYPLFLGTEESQDHLSLPSSLLLRMTHLGSSSELTLAIKSWSRDFSPPTFSVSSAT